MKILEVDHHSGAVFLIAEWQGVSVGSSPSSVIHPFDWANDGACPLVEVVGKESKQIPTFLGLHFQSRLCIGGVAFLLALHGGFDLFSAAIVAASLGGSFFGIRLWTTAAFSPRTLTSPSIVMELLFWSIGGGALGIFGITSIFYWGSVFSQRIVQRRFRRHVNTAPPIALSFLFWMALLVMLQWGLWGRYGLQLLLGAV